MNTPDISKYCISTSATVWQVVEVIDKNKDGIVLVLDNDGRLVGTITDGDIRRFLLSNRSLDESCTNVMWTNPITAPVGSSLDSLRVIMNQHRLRNIPLVDNLNHPKGVIHLRDLVPHSESKLAAVIMAGGEGRRLRPLTEHMPKSMVPVGERPILENIITGLAKADIKSLFIAVNYHAKMIEDYFKNGENYGVRITYLREKKKLGTAGALALLPEDASEFILVINGDVVTNINFSRLIDFHQHHRCVVSVAAIQYHFDIPYGVLDLAGHYVLGIEEKPLQRFLCNAGIYIINSELLRFVPHDKAYDMTDLLNDVVREGLPVAAFPIHEYWIDIGQKQDLSKAREDFTNIFGSKKKEDQ
jgi:dTDP-glucose pyrophosphorylase